MPHPSITERQFALTTVQDEHIEYIRQWRNAQLNVLRQKVPISLEQQVRYFENRIWPALEERHPQNILLIFLKDDQPIGYGGLVHVAWEDRRAEVSFLLAPDRAESLAEYRRYFTIFLCLLKRLAFDHLGFVRLFTETFAFRSDHMNVLEANGFRREGRLRSHVEIDGARHDSLVHGVLCDDQ